MDKIKIGNKYNTRSGNTDKYMCVCEDIQSPKVLGGRSFPLHFDIAVRSFYLYYENDGSLLICLIEGKKGRKKAKIVDVVR